MPNPLREGLRLERIAEPCTMIICGATGDLTERKLGPALYNTMLGGFLPPEFTVVMRKGVLHCRLCGRRTEFPILFDGLTLVFPCTMWNLVMTVGEPVHDNSRAQAQELPMQATHVECLEKLRTVAHNLFTGRTVRP